MSNIHTSIHNPDTFSASQAYGGNNHVGAVGGRVSVSVHSPDAVQVKEALVTGAPITYIDGEYGLFYTMDVSVFGVDLMIFFRDLDMLWETAAGVVAPAEKVAA